MNTENKNQLTPAEAVDAIKQAYKLLSGATSSRHIIFTSPAPSSTEAAARKNIIQAKNLLDVTIALMRM